MCGIVARLAKADHGRSCPATPATPAAADGAEVERAVARLREQMALLERATQQEQNKESLIEDLRREAEQRRFQGRQRCRRWKSCASGNI